MTLKERRKLYNYSQEQFANFLEIPLRTYKRYESNEDKIPKIKHKYILSKIDELDLLDEEHGVLTVDAIKEICARVFENYEVEYCYLFGSYAKGYATGTSDVDLLISTSIKGIQFFGLVEELREELKKKVDLLDHLQLRNNFNLTNEILKDGIRIYGRKV